VVGRGEGAPFKKGICHVTNDWGGGGGGRKTVRKKKHVELR